MIEIFEQMCPTFQVIMFKMVKLLLKVMKIHGKASLNQYNQLCITTYCLKKCECNSRKCIFLLVLFMYRCAGCKLATQKINVNKQSRNTTIVQNNFIHCSLVVVLHFTTANHKKSWNSMKY